MSYLILPLNLSLCFQLGAMIFVLVGLVIEIKRKAHWGYIFLTFAGWLAFVGEKLRLVILR